MKNIEINKASFADNLTSEIVIFFYILIFKKIMSTSTGKLLIIDAFELKYVHIIIINIKLFRSKEIC